MSAQDEKAAAKEVGEEVVALIEAEVLAVMEAVGEAKALVDQAAHDASQESIIHGQPPDTARKHFWAQLLREVIRADPNTPTPDA